MTDSPQARIGALERDVERLGRLIDTLHAELGHLRAELRARGVVVPPTPPEGEPPLSEDALRALQVRKAAHMRECKKKGTGKGCVSPEVYERIHGGE
jgi:hypothetical protein